MMKAATGLLRIRHAFTFLPFTLLACSSSQDAPVPEERGFLVQSQVLRADSGALAVASGPDAGVGPVVGADSLATFDLDCADPVVTPSSLLNPTETEEPEPPSRAISALKTTTPSVQSLSFVGSGSLAGTSMPQASSLCASIANDNFFADLKGPANFPAINFPEVDCDVPDCWSAREGWMRAHYYTWVARSIIHQIAAADHVEQRKYLWKQPGLHKGGGSAGVKTSPEYWFGSWSTTRFNTVKQALDKLWGVLTTNKTGGITVKLRCPEPGLHPANVCFTKKPAAHHWVKGTVDLCYGYFKTDRSDADRGRLIAHEFLHHLFVDYGNASVAIQDTHYHSHGLGCGISPKTEQSYGEDKIRELATYTNSNGNDCGHRARNVRNNDTYAQFIRSVGDAVYKGSMVEWPLPAPPTPKPPECQGEENCLCSDQSSWPLNEYFEPDGDYSPDQWCPDNDGEMTCMETSFGASTEGICKKCDDFRGPGCECDWQRPCAVGSCFGDDTFGGGVGHCFKDPPPTWACLADCKRLFNSPGAWCYADYPTGQARCMDHLCEAPDAWACAQQGKVCRYGQCVVECNNTADCAAKGYPSYFECKSNRCEYAFY